MPELASPFRLMAVPRSARIGRTSDCRFAPGCGSDSRCCIEQANGRGSVAGIKVGIEVRSTFGNAAAQFNAKPHPVNARKEIHTTRMSTNPINTPYLFYENHPYLLPLLQSTDEVDHIPAFTYGRFSLSAGIVPGIPLVMTMKMAPSLKNWTAGLVRSAGFLFCKISRYWAVSFAATP